MKAVCSVLEWVYPDIVFIGDDCTQIGYKRLQPVSAQFCQEHRVLQGDAVVLTSLVDPHQAARIGNVVGKPGNASWAIAGGRPEVETRQNPAACLIQGGLDLLVEPGQMTLSLLFIIEGLAGCGITTK